MGICRPHILARGVQADTDNAPKTIIESLDQNYRFCEAFFRNKKSSNVQAGWRLTYPGGTSARFRRIIYEDFSGGWAVHRIQSWHPGVPNQLRARNKLELDVEDASEVVAQMLAWAEDEIKSDFEPPGFINFHPIEVVELGTSSADSTETKLWEADGQYRLLDVHVSNKKSSQVNCAIAMTPAGESVSWKWALASQNVPARSAVDMYAAQHLYAGYPIEKGDAFSFWTADASEVAVDVTVIPENQFYLRKHF